MCTHVVGTDFRFTGRLGGVSACPLPTNNIQREGDTVRPGRVQCSARRRSLLYGEREMACPQNVFDLLSPYKQKQTKPPDTQKKPFH